MAIGLYRGNRFFNGFLVRLWLIGRYIGLRRGWSIGVFVRGTVVLLRSWAQCYKTFYDRNLRIFVKS